MAAIFQVQEQYIARNINPEFIDLRSRAPYTEVRHDHSQLGEPDRRGRTNGTSPALDQLTRVYSM